MASRSFSVDRRERSAFLLAGALLSIFAVVFGLVRSKRSAAADLAITMKFQQQRHPVLRRVMAVVSWPGFPPQSRLIPPGLVLTLALLGHPLEALFQLLAWGTGGISFTFKRIMQRQRPSHPDVAVAIARIGGSSFPSGHVLNYLGVYGFLAYLIWTQVQPSRLRTAALALLGSMLALVGPSRIYLGHHWFTDVLASYLLGISYLIGLTALYRRVRSFLG